MSQKLDGRTAIVTGSSSGIGRKIAIDFADEGANVVLASRSRDPKLDEKEYSTGEIIEQNGGEAIFHKTDVTDPDDIDSMVETAISKYGGIDILVNNAGVESHNPIHKVTDEEWEHVHKVNNYGIYRCSKSAIPYLLESDQARIINISSQRGLRGGATEDLAAYVSSKGAASNLTRQMAIDYGPKGIAVNAICPGPIFTNMVNPENETEREQVLDGVLTPFIGEPKDISAAAVFLASEHGRYIHGENLVIDGGYLVDTTGV